MLNDLWKVGSDFLQSEFAIMGGAMSWLSEHSLVSAISNAGGFGIIACGAMSAEMLEQEIIKTQKLTSCSFGVNLILMHPNLNDLIEVCIDSKVTHIVLAGGIPKGSVIRRIKENGVAVICFAPSLSVANRLVFLGVDGIIIEGMEAGGHIGRVSTSVLAQEILPSFRKNSDLRKMPIFVAGGIGSGEMIVNYLNMGASGCQIGTLFACAFESIAHVNFKKAFIRASSKDAVPSVQLSSDFPVIPVRAISNEATHDFLNLQRTVIEEYRDSKISKQDGQLMVEKFWAGALKIAVIDGEVVRGSLMAGQSVGMVTKEQSVQDIINSLVREAKEYLEYLQQKIKVSNFVS